MRHPCYVVHADTPHPPHPGTHASAPNDGLLTHTSRVADPAAHVGTPPTRRWVMCVTPCPRRCQQRLKLDTEAAMLELDQILRANELSISLVAAVPSLLLSWTLLRAMWTLLLVRPPPDPRRDATPCR